METRLALLLIAVTACSPPAGDIKGDGPTPKVDAAEPAPASLQVAPMAWVMVADRSVSWERHLNRFDGLRAAMGSFVTAHPGVITFAATSFPKLDGTTTSCAREAYVTPDLAFGATPAELDAHLLVPPGEGGSALGPALAGAGAIASDYATTHRDAETAIVLLTDATPFDDETCDDSDWDQVAARAGSIFAGGAGPHVHVVSVLGIGVSDDHFARLDAIAAAGGGFVAFVNGSTDDVARGTRTALDIMAERATCTRLLEGARPDVLDVAFSDGTRTLAHRVADATACEPNAFYVDDPAAPTKATLCSGRAGIGGLCELTYLRARSAGPPSITPTTP